MSAPLTIDTAIALDLDAEVGKLREKLHPVEGGLVLLLAAVKAGDPTNQIIWRIEEELRQIRRST
jgi:hypothetical protein